MNILPKIWQTLTSPHPSLQDIEQRQQSQLLAGLVISLILTSLIASSLLIGLFGGITSTVTGLWASIAFILIVYFINRSGYYRVSAIIFVVFNLAVTCIMPILTHTLEWLLFTPMVLLLSAMLLPGLTVTAFFLCFFAQIMLAILFPLSTNMSNAGVLIVYIIIGSLVLVFMKHRIRLERERQEELQTINESLRRSEAELENRVTERTVELSGANEKMQEQLQKINILQEKLREEAIRDPLTGLFNRRYLEETLIREFARAQRANYDIGFMLLDIDHFKKINDLYGHSAGDMVLATLSKQLKSQIRVADIPCRIGGEEFLLVLSGMSEEMTQLRAEDFRKQIQSMRIPHDGNSINLTVSIGVASYPKNGENWEDLYHVADQALYRAKQKGRNRVEFG
jgi:diguanylate cyclase (GGDEF)-like protein